MLLSVVDSMVMLKMEPEFMLLNLRLQTIIPSESDFTRPSVFSQTKFPSEVAGSI
jgi:hypothetical protein